MDDKPVLGTMGPELDAKLEQLDDNLQPIKEIPKDEPTKPEEKSEEKPEDKKTEEDKKPDEKQAEVAEGTEEEDEGYAIDEGEEEDEELVAAKTDETVKSNFTPEQQFILDGLTPVKVRGEVDGKTQEFTVLSPDQLPNGFKYVDDRESAIANKAFAMLETQATNLQTEFRNQETTKSSKAFKEAEDNADRTDIGTLQRDGDIPKFKVDSNDPKFNEDPAAVLIQDILDFKDKKNNQYLEESKVGRPYKHIGFTEAFYMYRRENPTKANVEQAKEDAEREALAKRTANTTGAKDQPKARVHSGMGTMDLDALIEERTQGW